MGNYPAKERNGAPGSPLDRFQTPPTSPQTSPGSAPPLSNPTHSDTNPTPDPTSSPPTDPASTVIGQRGRQSLDKTGSVSVKAGGFPISPRRQGGVDVRSLRRSLTDTTPPERLQVSASPVQVAPPTTVLSSVDQGLLQECVAALGFRSVEEKSDTLRDLLKCFLTEREQMKEELRSQQEKMQAERSEWLQFQSDLQVALVVADRLRAEAEEELTTLREAHHDWEKQLADTQQRQQEVEGQMEHLKAELEQSRQRLSQGSEPPSQKGVLLFRDRERGAKEEHLRSVECPEKGENQKEVTDTRTTERSRNLSRPPLDPPASVVNGISQTSVALTTRSLNKNNNQTRERQDNLVNLCKDKKDNSSLHLSSSPLIDLLPNKVTRTKPQEDLSTLLRRHGGSKRNSLLRWCQNRTQGYPNIEITNFSSSWVDGLAFCAVYHSYLPSHIPYNTLSPENKKENLSLAFQTGVCVGITASLTLEEMMRTEGPDWQRVLGYVESIYRHFEM
ncbi:cytospin-A [Brachyhypopomus gauderio]|uniref:cytospin-A n=1 Tax=Brachyhypopomus gauderio TaxID=698409 RepID=UPI004041F679